MRRWFPHEVEAGAKILVQYTSTSTAPCSAEFHHRQRRKPALRLEQREVIGRLHLHHAGGGDTRAAIEETRANPVPALTLLPAKFSERKRGEIAWQRPMQA